MSKKNQGLVHARRIQLELAISSTPKRTGASETESQEEEIDEDVNVNTNTHDVHNHVKSQKASPLKLNETFVCIKCEDTVIGSRSMEVLRRVPRFNGIRTRVPAYFVLDAKTRNPISMVPQLNALTMFFHSIMARKILPANVTLAVSQI